MVNPRMRRSSLLVVAYLIEGIEVEMGVARGEELSALMSVYGWLGRTMQQTIQFVWILQNGLTSSSCTRAKLWAGHRPAPR